MDWCLMKHRAVLCKVSLCLQFLISWNGNGGDEVEEKYKITTKHTQHIYSKANKNEEKKKKKINCGKGTHETNREKRIDENN